MFLQQIDKIINHIKEDENFFDSASLLLKGKKITAKILLKNSNIVISGLEIAKIIYDKFGIKINTKFNDGDFITEDTNKAEHIIEIASIAGDAYYILLTERTILNLLSLMSSVATKTYKIQNSIKEKGYKTRIAATRKILPSIGYFQKLAVIHGGGDPHRIHLSDTIMIKDNHKKLYGSIEKAIKSIKAIKSFTQKLEVEVETLDEGLNALKMGADIIMLDNFKPEEAKKVAKILKNNNKNIIIEVSGGISENNFSNYLDNSIDIISMGSLTTEIKYTDISLEIYNS